MDFSLPEIGEGVYEAELTAWRVKAGDNVKRGQTLVEVLTDKATMEIPSPFHGVITALYAEPGQRVKVGDRLLSYQPTGQQARVPQPTPDVPQIATSPSNVSKSIGRTNGPVLHSGQRLPVKAAPSVRYLARKLGIDLAAVQGSGPEGRVLLDDITGQMQRLQTVPEAAPASKPPARPDYGKPGTRLKLAGLRRKIAEHMVQAKRTIPHYSYVEECDVTELVRLRDSLREVYSRLGVKLTYLAFFVKAAAAALKEVPLVNASLDEAAGEIVLHDRYHIGVAVATPGGLIVPVVHDVDKKDLTTIARDIERLSQEARTGKVRLEDLRGGTFTVTSVGNVGGLFSTPVINHPEVGILGLGKVVRRPVFDDKGEIKAADLIYLSMSFDHRVVDGAVGAVFTNAIVRQVQNPAAMLVTERVG
jgi:pyruvate dehydrogenase E2 component (dihydrolipoamide acetyltransferase)/2-oxoisovalerate dehydrogenase E2 component (dihydrolipoyl transacylase)